MSLTKKELDELERRAKIIGGLKVDEIVNLIATARDLQVVVNDWYGFLAQMAKVSSWRERIQEKLDLYDFGTTDKAVIAAAKHYLERKEQRGSIADNVNRIN